MSFEHWVVEKLDKFLSQLPFAISFVLGIIIVMAFFSYFIDKSPFLKNKWRKIRDNINLDNHSDIHTKIKSNKDEIEQLKKNDERIFTKLSDIEKGRDEDKYLSRRIEEKVDRLLFILIDKKIEDIKGEEENGKSK